MSKLGKPALFQQMLEFQHVEAAEAEQSCHDMIERAARRCLDCRDPELCHAWFALSHPVRTYPAVCPNGSIIEACRIMIDPLAARAPGEPGMSEALTDPIVQAVATADGVRPTAKLPSR
jgi:hypothetical protein